MSVISLLRVSVRPGAEKDLARAFCDLAVFEHARRSGGFRGGRLLRPLRAREPFLVFAEWDDAASYEAWLHDPIREDLKRALEPLVADDVSRGELYEVVL